MRDDVEFFTYKLSNLHPVKVGTVVRLQTTNLKTVYRLDVRVTKIEGDRYEGRIKVVSPTDERLFLNYEINRDEHVKFGKNNISGLG